MRVYKRYTEEEKTVFLEKLLAELRNGENRGKQLAEKIGIPVATIRRFQKQLIDER